jgi:hypothetical protein
VTRRRRAVVQIVLGTAGLGILAIPVMAVILSGAASTDPLWTALRLAALEAFSLIFASIVVGAFRPLFNRAFKPRTVHRLHVVTGTAGFVLALAHPIMLLVRGLAGYSLIFLWIGPAALAVLALAVLVALARKKLRLSWRWVHRLNYLVFAAVFVHGSRLGYDLTGTLWLKIWFLACAAFVACGLAYRFAVLRRRPAR